MVGIWCYNQSGVTELLIMKYTHYGRMCLSQLKPSELLAFLDVETAEASAFSTAKNEELLGLYPIHKLH